MKTNNQSGRSTLSETTKSWISTTNYWGTISFICLIISLFITPIVSAETVVVYNDGTRRFIDRPTSKYMDLDKCTIGNTRDFCRGEWIKETKEKGKKLSKVTDRVVVYSWMEVAEDEAPYISRISKKK